MEPEDLQRLSEQIAVEATESGVLLKPRTATGSIIGKHDHAMEQGQGRRTLGQCSAVPAGAGCSGSQRAGEAHDGGLTAAVWTSCFCWSMQAVRYRQVV